MMAMVQVMPRPSTKLTTFVILARERSPSMMPERHTMAKAQPASPAIILFVSFCRQIFIKNFSMNYRMAVFIASPPISNAYSRHVDTDCITIGFQYRLTNKAMNTIRHTIGSQRMSLPLRVPALRAIISCSLAESHSTPLTSNIMPNARSTM